MGSEELSAIQIAMPPLAEQRSIAAALDGMDATTEWVRSEHASLHASKASATDAPLTGKVLVRCRIPLSRRMQSEGWIQKLLRYSVSTRIRSEVTESSGGDGKCEQICEPGKASGVMES